VGEEGWEGEREQSGAGENHQNVLFLHFNLLLQNEVSTPNVVKSKIKKKPDQKSANTKTKKNPLMF